MASAETGAMAGDKRHTGIFAKKSNWNSIPAIIPLRLKP
jgi:hypothetical protein